MIKEPVVYFARCIGPFGQPIGAVKIGCSGMVGTRIVSAARCQPYKLELIGTIYGGAVTETLVHLALRAHRIDGEFFHDNPYVQSFIAHAIDRGSPLFYVSMGRGVGHLPTAATEAFMCFHGVTLQQVAKFLGANLKYLESQVAKNNGKIIAATALIAQRDRRFVSWPEDAVRGLLGQTHGNGGKSLPAPSAPPSTPTEQVA